MNKPRFTQRGALRKHDYSGRCIYHVTLVVSDRLPLLGWLDAQGWEDNKGIGRETTDTQNGNHTISYRRSVPERWMVRLCHSDLGEEVARKVRAIPTICHAKGLDVQILAQQCMDTHIHFILFIKSPMEHTTVGDIIRGFKQGCNKLLRQWLVSHFPQPSVTTTNGMAVDREGRFTAEPTDTAPAIHRPNGTTITLTPRILQQHALFEPAYDITILYRRGQLRSMIDYIHDNPWRKWLKQHHKDRFFPQRGINIAGTAYDTVGNIMLLGLKRRCVHVRRHFTTEERRAYMNECILEAREGVVLVSPFISPYEAQVRDCALKEGHSIMVLAHQGISDFTTFPEPLLSSILQGQTLVLFPPFKEKHQSLSHTITRSECQSLNAQAESIAAES